MTLRTTFTAMFAATAVVALSHVVAADEASEQKLKATKQCVGCELINADLTGAQLTGADLRDANLSGATFYGGDLANANLTNANLTGTNLSGTNLRGALGASLALAQTNERTTCPNGQSGPCN
jgi:uncharacterized protein YjbI with pentapeptide repeats